MKQKDKERLAHQMVSFYEKLNNWELSVVKESGHSISQIHALEVLGTHSSMKMKDLAAHMGITTGTLTVMIDKMEKASLLRRVPHENDRRSYIIELTPQGEKEFHHHVKLHQALTEELTCNMSSSEISTLIKLFDKMNSNVC